MENDENNNPQRGGGRGRPRPRPRPTPPPAPPPSPENRTIRRFDLNLFPAQNDWHNLVEEAQQMVQGRRARRLVPLNALPDAHTLRTALLGLDLNRHPHMHAGQVPRVLAPVPHPAPVPVATPPLRPRSPDPAPPRRPFWGPAVIRPVPLPYASRSALLAEIATGAPINAAGAAALHHIPAPAAPPALVSASNSHPPSPPASSPYVYRSPSPVTPPPASRSPSPTPAAAVIRPFSPPPPVSSPSPVRPSSPPGSPRPAPTLPPLPPATCAPPPVRPFSPPPPPPAAATLASTPTPADPSPATLSSPPPRSPSPPHPTAVPSSTSLPDRPLSGDGSIPGPRALRKFLNSAYPHPPPRAPAALPSTSPRLRATRARLVSTAAPPPPTSPLPSSSRPAPAKRPRPASLAPPPPPPPPALRSPPRAPPAVRPRSVNVSPPSRARQPAPKRKFDESAPPPAVTPPGPALPYLSAPVLRPRSSGIVIRENNEEAREQAARARNAAASQRGASNSRAKDKGKAKTSPETDQAKNRESIPDVPIEQVLRSLHPQTQGRRSSRTAPPTLLGSSSVNPRQAGIESRELVALEALGRLLPARQGTSFEGSNVNGDSDPVSERHSSSMTRERRSKSGSAMAGDRNVSWHNLELTLVQPSEMQGYIDGAGSGGNTSKRMRTTASGATNSANLPAAGVSRWERLPAGLYHAPAGSRMETARKAGELSFFLGYSLRERAWLQTYQRDLMNGLCSPPKHQQPKSRKLDSRKSRFQGVNYYRRTKRWEAHIWETPKKLDGKQQYLGSCYNELEAARHYDRGSLKFRGPNTNLNFKSCSYKDCKKEIYRMTRNQFLEWSRCMARRCIDSHFFGTRFDPRRNQWKAEYKIQNPLTKRDGTLSCGFFETELEAARAYDQVSIEVNGSVAITNFSLLEYNIQSILRTSSINRQGLHRVDTERLRNKARSKTTKKTTGNQVVTAKSSPRRSGRNENSGQVRSGQTGNPSLQSGSTFTLAQAASAYEELERSRAASVTVEPLQVLRLGGSQHPSAILNAETNLDPVSRNTTETGRDDPDDQSQANKATTETSNIPLWTDKKSRFWRPS